MAHFSDFFCQALSPCYTGDRYRKRFTVKMFFEWKPRKARCRARVLELDVPCTCTDDKIFIVWFPQCIDAHHCFHCAVLNVQYYGHL